MTKAYIAGFCKKAEEYGVNPKALIKVAAGEYEGAKPPPSATIVGSKNIPMIDPSDPSELSGGGFFSFLPTPPFGNSRSEFNSSLATGAVDHNDLIGRFPENIAALELGVTDPKYWGAHTTAVARATAPWRKAVIRGARHMDDSIRDATIRKYHDEMASLTGTPTRVSAPYTDNAHSTPQPPLPQPSLTPPPPAPSAPDHIDMAMPKLPLPKAPGVKPYIKPYSK